jgi:hypothetical protein
MKKNKILFLSILFIVASLGIFFYKDYIAKGATYGFIQSSWSGGQTANTAVHPTNENNWNQYSAKDANTSAGATVSITSEITALTHTLSADFSGGTGTGVLTTGDQVSMDLP